MSPALDRLRALLSHRSRFAGLLSVVLQAVLLVVTFSRLVFHPGQYLIVNHFDGIKSYFSIAAFLEQPLSDGMVVTGHNYPFGEYMYYTDSTPLLAEALHVLVRAVPALAPYGLYLYDLVILGGLLLATWLLHRILRPWQLPTWLHVLACVALPWISPQTIRLNVGHMSLSYVPAVLFTVWALQEIYLRTEAGRPRRGWLLALGLSMLVASYWHFYYLAILGMLAGCFMLVWAAERYLTQRPFWPVLREIGLTLLLTLVVTAGSLMVLDGRYGQRPTGSSGYDWVGWKLHFGGFIQAQPYSKVRFLFEPVPLVPYESTAYLGGFVLYALLTMLVLRLARRFPQTEPLRATEHGRFLLLLLLASVPLVLIALGEKYELGQGEDQYMIRNYLNPFFWLHKITDRVTQFRAIGRFVWPFWWALNLLLLWLMTQWWQRARWQPARWLAVVLPLLLVPDLLMAVRFYRHDTQQPNLLADAAELQPMKDLVGWVDRQQYQAILPIPYYHVGSEGDYSYTVDPDDPHCNRTYQLAMLTHLPLMSHKAVRTPPEQAQQLYSIFRPEGPDPALLARLDSRPILVYLDSSYYSGQDNYYRETLKDRAGMLSTFEYGDDFVRNQHLRLLNKQGSRALYVWYPKGNVPAAPAASSAPSAQ